MPLLSSSQSQKTSAMEASGERPERKQSKREMKASRSATLPPGAVLMAQPGEGFFSKIRRCLRLRSKGKYDFNHSHPATESDAGSSSAQRCRSTGSAPVNEDGDAGKLSAKSSPHKASRKSKSDKEEVVLVRKDQRNSSGIRLGNKRVVEGSSKDEVLVVTIGAGESKEEQGTVAGASGVGLGSENKENNEVFEDIDPDYETLDDIRRKVHSQSQADCSDRPAAPADPATDESKTTVRQPLQVKIKASSDLNRQDSGLGSPFAESPGSSRESQAHSVTSSVFSNSAAFSDNSEHCRETTQSMSSAGVINGIPASAADSDPMVTSSTSSLNCSNSVLEEDDLYSNAKIMIRKKSQKQSQSHTSLCTPEQRSSGLFADQSRSARNSLSPADLLALMEAESPDPPVPPPLPARNYSEEDIATKVNEIDTHDVTATNSDSGSNNVSASGEFNSSVSSETLCNGTGARPKTSKLNAFVEQGPVVTINSNQDAAQRTDDELSDADAPLPEPQDPQTPLTPTNNIYEDIPARIDTKQSEPQVPLQNEEKKHEDSLMFIDEDPSADGDCHSERTETSELPEDVMIVSASDSMCGNDTDDSHGTSDSTGAMELHLHVEVSSSDKLEAGSPTLSDNKAENADLPQEERKMISQNSGHDSPKSESCSKTDSKEDISDHQSETATAPSSSSSHHLSISSSSTTSTSSTSSSDTLNDIMDNNPDPDDLEGKDLSPPMGPPIHVSHRQLQQRRDTRKREEEPPPLPLHRPHSARRNNPTATARNVRSMEILSCHRMARANSRPEPAPAISSRRHSSSAAVSRAHRDFLASMKQLKDCGWYWGPLSYEEAESKLTDKRDGSFLVRDSSNENYILSLSFKSLGQVHHTRIEHHKGLFSFWSQPDSHGKAQICQFIEQTVENSKNGRFLYFLRPAGPGSPPLPIQLLYPVSRFCRVPSLQHMCRFPRSPESAERPHRSPATATESEGILVGKTVLRGNFGRRLIGEKQCLGKATFLSCGSSCSW